MPKLIANIHAYLVNLSEPTPAN
jgi:hypothetical protein